eukprot:TRINITY_DN7271_c0_g2_i2.p1 TRINITY_DN7271_c0_g2~~TRINITY_DN7271_c0_g2_i2.p1  ORF type:complete len:259 (+),score=30.77 TRINITY_DN7271_c0_g2_i2:33-779(+)
MDPLPLIAAGLLTAGAAYVSAKYYPAIEARLEEAGLHPKVLLAQSELDGEDSVAFETVELSKTAQAASDHLEATAHTKFDDSNADHIAMLEQLWREMMPSEPYPGRSNRIWGEVGFQGSDPVTDLRGMGMLGLESLVYIATHHKDLVQRIHRQPNDTYFYFFAIGGINIASSVLHLLRDAPVLANLLYQEASSQQRVRNVYYELVAETWLDFDVVREAFFDIRRLSECVAIVQDIFPFRPLLEQYVSQ